MRALEFVISCALIAQVKLESATELRVSELVTDAIRYGNAPMSRGR
ncbi:hypothetical protein [Streptomyces sp. T21Q-yed]|nr:hypothetical protein [Streptomyces sp. T21Q-yed]MDF3140498.1 hypothetical protein [Streptomyces sp. T21Q-yed]